MSGISPNVLLGQNKASYNDYLKWIGNWRLTQSGEEKTPEIQEIWTRSKNGILEGKSIQINPESGDVLILEELRIQKKGKKIFYQAEVPNQNKGKSIYFHLTLQDSNSFTFENLTHDYPQIIHYEFSNEEEMSVTLSAPSNKKSTNQQTLKFRKNLSFTQPD